MKKILMSIVMFLMSSNMIFALAINSKIKENKEIPYWKTKKHINFDLELERSRSQCFYEYFFEKRWHKYASFKYSEFKIAKKKYSKKYKTIPAYELKVFQGKLCLNDKLFNSPICHRTMYYVTKDLRIYVYFEGMFGKIRKLIINKDIISFGEMEVIFGKIYNVKNTFRLIFNEFIQIIDVLYIKKFIFKKTFVESDTLNLILNTYYGNIKVRDLNWENNINKSC